MAKIEFAQATEAQNKGALYTTILKSNGREFVADEPKESGGQDLGPSPFDYLRMSLASCKAITLRMYIQRKQWKVDTINVKVALSSRESQDQRLNTFYCEITFTGSLNEAQQKRLLEIAKVCPVSRLLSQQNEIVTTIQSI
jgi:putative redox protein